MKICTVNICSARGTELSDARGINTVESAFAATELCLSVWDTFLASVSRKPNVGSHRSDCFSTILYILHHSPTPNWSRSIAFVF